MARRDIHAARRILAQQLRRLRIARRLSQEELAHAAGLSQDQISEMENTKHSTTLDNVQRLAFALGVTVAELLGEERD
jgi:transcriptional regulator with XRE-family HTH domain